MIKHKHDRHSPVDQPIAPSAQPLRLDHCSPHHVVPTDEWLTVSYNGESRFTCFVLTVSPFFSVKTRGCDRRSPVDHQHDPIGNHHDGGFPSCSRRPRVTLACSRRVPSRLATGLHDHLQVSIHFAFSLLLSFVFSPYVWPSFSRSFRVSTRLAMFSRVFILLTRVSTCLLGGPPLLSLPPSPLATVQRTMAGLHGPLASGEMEGMGSFPATVQRAVVNPRDLPASGGLDMFQSVSFKSCVL